MINDNTSESEHEWKLSKWEVVDSDSGSKMKAELQKFLKLFEELEEAGETASDSDERGQDHHQAAAWIFTNPALHYNFNYDSTLATSSW